MNSLSATSPPPTTLLTACLVLSTYPLHLCRSCSPPQSCLRSASFSAPRHHLATSAGNLWPGAASFLAFLETIPANPAEAFPLSDHVLYLWALWLADAGKSPDTVKSYFNDAVAYQLSQWGGALVDRASFPLFGLVLKHLQKQPRQPAAAPLVRHPIERQHLAVIRNALDISTPRGAVLWAACCAAFYGLMRVGEFTTKDALPFSPAWQATRKDFQRGWDPVHRQHYWSLQLPRTKTGLPGTVYLGFSGQFDCPFTAINHMIYVVPTRSPDDPAFNFGPAEPLLRSTFIDAVRAPLLRAGCTLGIHGHSFRIEGATLLAAAGYPDHIIKLAGRWQSDAFLVYIRSHHRLIPPTVAIAASLPFPPSWRSLA